METYLIGVAIALLLSVVILLKALSYGLPAKRFIIPFGILSITISWGFVAVIIMVALYFTIVEEPEYDTKTNKG